MNEQLRESLCNFREIAGALAHQHLNHDHRRAQMEMLVNMLEYSRRGKEESEYLITLNALIAIVNYAHDDTRLTHTEVKTALYLFVGMCQAAIEKGYVPSPNEHRFVPQSAADNIPF